MCCVNMYFWIVQCVAIQDFIRSTNSHMFTIDIIYSAVLRTFLGFGANELLDFDNVVNET